MASAFRYLGLIGSFFLFAAFALLLVATISAPVFRQINFLQIFRNNITTELGTFGYCVTGVCSGRTVGYDITVVSAILGGNPTADSVLRRLTGALILHPIAAGLAFIAFVISLIPKKVGAILGSATAGLAFLVALAVMIIDFILFVTIRNRLNDGFLGLNTGSRAILGNAIWLVLTAVILLLLSTFIVLFGLCASRKQKRLERNSIYPEVNRAAEARRAYPATAVVPLVAANSYPVSESHQAYSVADTREVYPAGDNHQTYPVLASHIPSDRQSSPAINTSNRQSYPLSSPNTTNYQSYPVVGANNSNRQSYPVSGANDTSLADGYPAYTGAGSRNGGSTGMDHNRDVNYAGGGHNSGIIGNNGHHGDDGLAPPIVAPFGLPTSRAY